MNILLHDDNDEDKVTSGNKINDNQDDNNDDVEDKRKRSSY